MTQIGILSDTHSYLDNAIFKHFEHCDEVWHIGDFGNDQLVEQLSHFKPLRGVYGNIDGDSIRKTFPQVASFQCEQMNILMTHIGGYPPRYNPTSKPLIKAHQPNIFLSGHSHILKIINDPAIKCLHINPGAAGIQGWHTVRTLVRIVIDGSVITKCEVIELRR